MIGYLLGALSAEERQEVEEELARSPHLLAELSRLRGFLFSSTDEEVEFEAPSDLAERTIQSVHDPVVRFGQVSAWAPGESLRWTDLLLMTSLLLVVSCLIFPALVSLRGDEGRLQCANQLRQIGVALEAYQSMEGGGLPTVGAQEPLNHAGVFSLLLQARDLLPDVSLLVCPMADSAVVYVPRMTEYLAMPADSVLRQLQAKEMAGSYGYSLGFLDGSGHHGPRVGDAYQAVVTDRPPRAEETVTKRTSPNHLGQGLNVLFADGHVLWQGEARVGSDDLFRNNHGVVGAGRGVRDVCIGVSEAVAFPASQVPSVRP